MIYRLGVDLCHRLDDAGRGDLGLNVDEELDEDSDLGAEVAELSSDMEPEGSRPRSVHED
jgi:hypothetical protein